MENASELEHQLTNYINQSSKRLLITIVDGRYRQQRLHMPFLRHLIDSIESSYNSNHRQEPKYFLILIHLSAHDLYHQSYFSSIFLNGWQFYFFDTCTPGSAFHLQKMLRIVSSSSYNEQSSDDSDNILCDLDILFEDFLWDFCSRIQFLLPKLSQGMFTNTKTYEFYQSHTNTFQRVKCLKDILRRSASLQKYIVDMYHKYFSL